MGRASPEEKAMDLAADLLIALRFFSRLPVPTTRREAALGDGGLAAAAIMVPVAGLMIGCFPAAALLDATAVGLPPAIAATLAIAVAIVVTGALHEDGLADCADGFGGGRTRERKLEIMRDSRVGAFGACAIALSLLLRATSLAAIAGRDTSRCALVILAAAALSRAAALLPLVLLPSARADGAGVTARPRPTRALFAALLAAAIAIGLLAPAAGALRVGVALVLAGVTALVICVLAWRQIGGQTGDVAGATQQGVEIMVYLVFAAAG